ncbi:AIR carboxylase family protein [Pseudobacteriovorax antillogorgiicola]|uniref:5-(Carboxyamino)imidazole ribonucleotide mutase n=1 Tax=Pseudobacteriovorax antillogorgiicola TaxID=1513793 RepID=A0A1Y6C4D7_9BACT|nr:AIR carboxylase family protein [Pseudobacteriovorax antillogorgiicola]TCS50264.1 5-(carboxyamino)imidazole ribonucleotide mutase [Pseudobacteriovorax antillogorgiicola]SMF33342.1 5-(carboxyamino)imidazole ribonucleotide mutase [Pseudobacteriovorax antillogorgiicola]
MTSVLVLVGSKSHLETLEDGLEIFKDLGVAFSVRIASAQGQFERLKDIAENHEQKGGSAIICVSENVASLGTVASAHTNLPVIAVSNLSDQSQVVLGLGSPVVTTGCSGQNGFCQAALFTAQVVGLRDPELLVKIKQYRQSQEARIEESDDLHRIDFKG